jgi:hypothetical protein
VRRCFTVQGTDDGDPARRAGTGKTVCQTAKALVLRSGNVCDAKTSGAARAKREVAARERGPIGMQPDLANVYEAKRSTNCFEFHALVEEEGGSFARDPQGKRGFPLRSTGY